MLTTPAEQLGVKHIELAKLLTMQLTVQGSQSWVNYGATAQIEYQGINVEWYFDLVNLQSYDLILGTPFLFQHCVMIGFHDIRVIVGSTTPLMIHGPQVQVLEARLTKLLEEKVEEVQRMLYALAKPLCAKASETVLPPLWAINHTIPLIDPEKIYLWCPLCCPEALCPQWVEKQWAYLASGQWKITSKGNTMPMLSIHKHGPDKLRTVIDL